MSEHADGLGQPGVQSLDWWVKTLTDHAQRGVVLDLSTLDEAPTLPNPHREHPDLEDDWELPPVADYPATASVPATAIRQVLLAPDLAPDPHGLHLHGAVITGTLDLEHATLPCPLALTYSHLQNKPNLEYAAVPHLALTGTRTPGLSADLIRITHGNFTAAYLAAEGEVRAVGAQIDGQLNLPGATLNNPDGDALSLDQTRITAGLSAPGLATHGEVRAIGAQIDGQLNLRGATLNNPGREALSLDNARITGSLFAPRLSATGEVRAPGAQIDGQFALPEAQLINPGRVALYLREVRVSSLSLDRLKEWKGVLDLTAATVDQLVVDSSATAVALKASGWHLGQVYGELRRDPGAFAAWLDSAPEGFTAQPWAQVAAFYDLSGQPGHARAIRVAAEARATKTLKQPTRTMRQVFYGGTVGYGHHPFQVVFWLLGAAAIASGIVWAFPSGFTLDPEALPDPTNPPTEPHPLPIAVATAVPASTDLLTTPWVPTNPWVQAVLITLQTGTWLLTALFIAGITGILRKRT